jgi:hypothetical protein
MKPTEAMDHLGIMSREGFALWCEKVQIQLYSYEFSNRKYLISGEFFAKADEIEIIKIKAIHGENWVNFYKHADDVMGFLPNQEQKDEPLSNYTPVCKEVLKFKQTLFNEKPSIKQIS